MTLSKNTRIRTIMFALVCSSTTACQTINTSTDSCQMSYPNVPGELLLENDAVVVQRFTIQPGQFEGIHRHPPNQLYIQLTDGDWRYKVGDDASDFSLPAGSASWNQDDTPLSAQHESGNVGNAPITYIWVGVKPGCSM